MGSWWSGEVSYSRAQKPNISLTTTCTCTDVVQRLHVIRTNCKYFTAADSRYLDTDQGQRDTCKNNDPVQLCALDCPLEVKSLLFRGCTTRPTSALTGQHRQPAAMSGEQYSIRVIRMPRQTPQRVARYATIFRQLRLQALRESVESFTERYDEAAARPLSQWEDAIANKNGLIHIGFGLPVARVADMPADSVEEQEDWIAEHGVPLGMAINTGPVPREHFLCPRGSRIPSTRSDDEEVRIHSNMLYVVAGLRGSRNRGVLFEALTLDRDRWILDVLTSVRVDPPPVARFRGTARAGQNQEKLIDFYVDAGWYVAGTMTWRQSVLAEEGEEGVRAAEARGDDMERVSVVVEKIMTVAHLERQVVRNQRRLAGFGKQNRRGKARL